MNKTGKNFHVVGFRFQILGDALGAIPPLSTEFRAIQIKKMDFFAKGVC